MLRKRIFWIALLVVVVAAGSGYYYYDTTYQAAEAAEEAPVRTATVRRGDLVVSASGTGTVTPAAEIELAFDSGGVLTEMLVQVGDTVQAGDILARVDDLAARQALANAELQVSKARSDLAAAEDQLDELLAGTSQTEILQAKAAVKRAEENLAQVEAGPTEAEMAQAEAALAAAQENYQRLLDGPEASEIEQAEMSLARAKNSLWSSQSSRDATCGEAQDSSKCVGAEVGVLNGEISVRQAEMALEELREPATQVEVREAGAQVMQAEERLAELRESPTAADVAEAEAQLAQAKDALEELTAGPSAEEITAAETQVEQARLSLDQAELNLEAAGEDLEGTTLTAPTDGTVMEVSAQAGERAGTAPVIILADLSQPYLEIFLDETDLDKIGAGYEVEVIFDALPDETFPGRVVQVDPRLFTSGGVSTIRAWVELEEGSFSRPQSLPEGSNATVDVIGGRAEGAVLVSIEALRELAPDEYAVFVMEDGEPKLRTVEVGLMDFTLAEITSGLEPGEVVTTGIVETE